MAFSAVEDLLPDPEQRVYSVKEAAREVDMEPARAERLMTTLGFSPATRDRLDEDDLQLLRYAAAVLPPDSRWWPSCSSCGSTARRWPSWPTPRCACSTCTSTSC